VCHHAEREYTMLTSWIADVPSTLPANASHRIGVGAFVLNKKTKEVTTIYRLLFLVHLFQSQWLDKESKSLEKV